MEAKSRLFEKRSREHCEAVLNHLQEKMKESSDPKYYNLAVDIEFWIEADPREKKLKRA